MVFCPLLEHECYGERCGWFGIGTTECSFALLTHSLNDISKELGEIADTLIRLQMREILTERNNITE